MAANADFPLAGMAFLRTGPAARLRLDSLPPPWAGF
jgi:hypothetical protein